jgi:membrane fusion protein (multidrug efflux system)
MLKPRWQILRRPLVSAFSVRWPIAPFLAMLGLSMFIACHKDAPQGNESDAASETAPLTVSVETVVRGAVADVLDIAGNLEPPPGMDVKLGALAIGRLAEIRVSEGDHVKAGQLLARIEATPLRDAVLQAEAAVKQARVQDEAAKARFKRTERLVTAGIAAQQEAEDARSQEAAGLAALHTAEAVLSTAQSQLGRTQLKAPFDGLVAHVFAAPGEPVDGSGKPIIEVAQTKVLELRAGLTATQSVRVRPGQLAEVRVDGLPDVPFAGHVIAVAPMVDPATGVAVARIRVDNPDGVLKGGTFARARLVTDLHSNVLVVPKTALVPSATPGSPTAAAVAVAEKGQAHVRPVETGYTDGQRVEVREGLHEGEQVIIAGAYALPDGTAIKIEAKPEQPVAHDGGSVE